MEVPIAEHSAPMAGSANSDSLRIAINENGAVYLGSLKTSPDDILPKVAGMVRSNPATGVYLWADRRTRYESCMDVLDNLRVAGVSKVGLITEQQGQQDAQKTTGNSVPMGEEVLLPEAPAPFRQIPSLSERYPLWDHGRLIAPIAIPKEIAGPKMCGAGWTMGCTVALMVDRGKNWNLNAEPVSPERVGGYLVEVFKTRAEKVVFFRGDPDLDYGTVVKAIDIAHGAGIDKIGMMTPKLLGGM
ncbi:MAG: ExbD/TolR family protein [Bryobacteraceae bacterium]